MCIHSTDKIYESSTRGLNLLLYVFKPQSLELDFIYYILRDTYI